MGLETNLAVIEKELVREDFNLVLSEIKKTESDFPDYKTHETKGHLLDYFKGQAIFRKEMEKSDAEYNSLIKAKDHFDESLKINPDFNAANTLTGMIYLTLSKHPKSKDVIYQGLKSKYHCETSKELDKRPENIAEMDANLDILKINLDQVYGVIFCLRNKEGIKEFKKEFKKFPWIKIKDADILTQEADAIVSPANSFGFMDGGLDYQLSEFFGWDLEKKLQKIIKEKHSGELIIGNAEILETGNKKIPYLISTPTMRVPMKIENTMNPYLATRAMFNAINEFNSKENKIKSVLIPSMGTGVGRIPYNIAARQMCVAYEKAVLQRTEFPKDFAEAQQEHRVLSTEHYRKLYEGKN